MMTYPVRNALLLQPQEFTIYDSETDSKRRDRDGDDADDKLRHGHDTNTPGGGDDDDDVATTTTGVGVDHGYCVPSGGVGVGSPLCGGRGVAVERLPSGGGLYVRVKDSTPAPSHLPPRHAALGSGTGFSSRYSGDSSDSSHRQLVKLLWPQHHLLTYPPQRLQIGPPTTTMTGDSNNNDDDSQQHKNLALTRRHATAGLLTGGGSGIGSGSGGGLGGSGVCLYELNGACLIHSNSAGVHNLIANPLEREYAEQQQYNDQQRHWEQQLQQWQVLEDLQQQVQQLTTTAQPANTNSSTSSSGGGSSSGVPLRLLDQLQVRVMVGLALVLGMVLSALCVVLFRFWRRWQRRRRLNLPRGYVQIGYGNLSYAPEQLIGQGSNGTMVYVGSCVRLSRRLHRRRLRAVVVLVLARVLVLVLVLVLGAGAGAGAGSSLTELLLHEFLRVPALASWLPTQSLTSGRRRQQLSMLCACVFVCVRFVCGMFVKVQGPPGRAGGGGEEAAQGVLHHGGQGDRAADEHQPPQRAALLPEGGLWGVHPPRTGAVRVRCSVWW
jgi:hypothetical protein